MRGMAAGGVDGGDTRGNDRGKRPDTGGTHIYQPPKTGYQGGNYIDNIPLSSDVIRSLFKLCIRTCKNVRTCKNPMLEH